MLLSNIRQRHISVANCHRAVMSGRPAVSARGGAIEEPTKGEPAMSLTSHLAELKRKHSDIEREIDEAMSHPSIDNLEIARLKRRKLALKDEMEKLKTPIPTRH